MAGYEQILQAVYDGVREVNEMDSDLKLPEAPDTAILGDGSQLASLSIVALATVTEESIDKAFDKSVSVIDIFMAVDTPSLDVAGLAERIAKRIGCPVPG